MCTAQYSVLWFTWKLRVQFRILHTVNVPLLSNVGGLYPEIIGIFEIVDIWNNNLQF